VKSDDKDLKIGNRKKTEHKRVKNGERGQASTLPKSVKKRNEHKEKTERRRRTEEKLKSANLLSRGAQKCDSSVKGLSLYPLDCSCVLFYSGSINSRAYQRGDVS